MHTPNFEGSWLSSTEPHLGYRVLPKCGCSSIGQIMHYIDHGGYCDKDVHYTAKTVLRWDDPVERERMIGILADRPVFWFTLVRNPFKRVLSAFADKIFGFQDNGKRYRNGDIHAHLHKRNLHWGPKCDLVENFKIFLQFVAETVETRKPMIPDVHWIPCFNHLAYTRRKNPGWNLDFVGHIESFDKDMEAVVTSVGIDKGKVPKNVPRENTTSLPEIPITTFYGEAEIKIMRRVYAKDFEVFGYSTDPLHTKPIRPLILSEVNASLQAVPKRTGTALPGQWSAP